ncbi:hypothetical protein [Streptomyces sp. NPDC056144]|uniref:hypothetical protein n=1 Tax=unclassified Streptomyces TaxID=2593676 RepID=UPI0035DF0719
MHNMDRTPLEYDAYAPEFEGAAGYGLQEAEGSLDEVQEMELAGELLEVADEAELDHFLGKLVRSAAPLLRGGPGKALQGLLKNAARQFLPVLGGAAGNLVLPGVGGLVGSQLASQAGGLFGLELEGLSPEDQEFEAARHFVRFAADAARTAADGDGEAEAEYEGEGETEFGAEFEADPEYAYAGESEGDFEGDFETDMMSGEFEAADFEAADFEGADLEASDFEEGFGQPGELEGGGEGVDEIDAGAARAALLSAAQRYAPGLVPLASAPGAPSYGAPSYGGPAYGRRRTSGRWIRRGRTIILLGI